MSERHRQGYMPWDRSGNRVLVKSELGKNRPTNYEIPEGKFVYGRLTYEDPEHVNDLIYKWKRHEPSHNANHLKEKDLIQTNKQCLRQLLSTSAQFSAHRKDHTQYKRAPEGTNVVKISLPEENHAYGKPLE